MLDLLTNPRGLYGIASDTTRRLLNQAFFHRLYLDTSDPDNTPRVSADDPTDPIAPLLHVTRAGKRKSGGVMTDTAATSASALLATALEEGCSSNTAWVDLMAAYSNTTPQVEELRRFRSTPVPRGPDRTGPEGG